MPVTTAAKTYVAGSDPEIESLVESAKKTVSEAGLTANEEELRQMIAKALGKATEAPKEEKPKAPAVDVNAGEGLKIQGSATAKTPKEGPYWYESAPDRETLEWFVTGRQRGMVEGNLIIVGPAGSGKTQGIFETATRLSVPIYPVDCPSITTIEKWVGHKEIDHTGTHFVVSEVMRYFEGREHRPGIVLLDEISRLHATFHNILFPILDGRRRIFIPEMHGYLDVHPETVVIATANIGGRFTGTYNLDHALRERFGYTLERDFPPEDEEIKVLTSRFPIPKDKAKMLVTIANRTRVKWRSGDLSLPISTRMLVNAAQAIRDGASISRALELSALTFYSSDGGDAAERTIVKGIIQGKGG